MAEKWRRYESLIIFDPDGGIEATEELIQRARNFVTQDGGRILKTERWGVRDLAFELKGRRKGCYLLLEYAGLPFVATELDRRLNLIDAVLKFQTIKLEDQVDPDSLADLEEVMVGDAPAQEPEETPADPGDSAPTTEEERPQVDEPEPTTEEEKPQVDESEPSPGETSEEAGPEKE